MSERPTPEQALERTGATPPALAARSFLQRFGLGKEPSKAAPYLRAILAGLQEMGSEQIKQIPVLGPLLSGAGAALLELAGEEDDNLLEEKVSQILTTSEQSWETLEALTALAAAIYMQQGALAARLQAVGLPAERQQLTAVALTTALAAWRGRVARDFQYADYRGIEGGTREEHAASLPLDEIYVIPRLVHEREQADTREREWKLLKELLDNQDMNAEERSRREEEFAVLTGERWRTVQKEGAEGRPVDHVLSQVRHAVVIGGPGVGKSTLTRFLARTCALGREAMKERFGDRMGWDEDLTPIVLPLAGYTDSRARHEELSLREYLDGTLVRCGGEVLREAIHRELQAGRVFLLLDGVDEIPDSRERILVVKAVDQFLADHAPNRFLLTSRPYGYVRLAGDIPHFQLPNFSPKEVKIFVYQWQQAFERWRHPQAPDLAKAESEAAKMLDEIQRNPKVFELATNPLMLVILALIRHEQARLPEERVQLYDRAAKTLMDTWNRGRSLAGIDVGGVQLPINNLVRVWGAVAAWTRQTKPTGVVHRAELTRKLVEILVDQELDENNPQATAESYLNAAADRAGLLEERGKDIFAFWHPTFEEFLAAVELTTPSSRAIERILPLRDDPRWREVILLAVGYLGIVQRDRETATDLVEAIWLNDPGPLETLLHSHLRLAASCVADDIGVRRSLAERIIISIGHVIVDYPYQPFIDTFSKTVRSLPHIRLSEEALLKLRHLSQYRDKAVRLGWARLAGAAGCDRLEAVQICRELLSDPDPEVRCLAGLGLLRSGDYQPMVWRAVNYLNSSSDVRTQIKEWFNAIPGLALDSLTSMLRDPEPLTRFAAASLLVPFGLELSAAFRVLISMSEVPDPALRYEAARLLTQYGGRPEHVVGLLEPLLKGRDIHKRFAAAGLLAELAKSSIPSSKALEPWLKGPDRLMQYWASRLLYDSGQELHLVNRVLLGLVDIDDPLIRSSVEWVLRQLRAMPRKEGEKRCELPDNKLQSSSNTVDTHTLHRRLMQDREDNMEHLEKMAKIAEPQPWASLAACQKVARGQPITEADGLALNRLVRARREDTGEQRIARTDLFYWLLKVLEPDLANSVAFLQGRYAYYS